MALFDQIGREPGQKEIQRRSAGELADADRPHLAIAKQLRHLPPVEARALLAAFDQATAVFDIGQLLRADFFVVERIAIQVQPGNTEHDADDTGAVEHMPPVVGSCQPQQQAGKQRGAQILATHVDAAGQTAFTCRKPHSDRAAVGRKGRGFQGAHRQTQAEQRSETAGQALANGDRRPGDERETIGKS